MFLWYEYFLLTSASNPIIVRMTTATEVCRLFLLHLGWQYCRSSTYGPIVVVLNGGEGKKDGEWAGQDGRAGAGRWAPVTGSHMTVAGCRVCECRAVERVACNASVESSSREAACLFPTPSWSPSVWSRHHLCVHTTCWLLQGSSAKLTKPIHCSVYLEFTHGPM